MSCVRAHDLIFRAPEWPEAFFTLSVILRQKALGTMTKTCLYVQTNPIGQMGGAAHSLIGITRKIKEHGWNPHVAVSTGSLLIDELRAIGVTVTPFDLRPMNLHAPLQTGLNFFRWIQLLKDVQPVIIHENTFGESLAFGWTPKILGIPYISHVRFPGSSDHFRYVLRRVPTPAAFIFNSFAMQASCSNEINKYASSAAQYVVHNAIDLSAFTPKEKPPSPPFRIAIIGNLAPYKRHDVFLQIAQGILKIRKDVEFLIMGDHSGYPGRIEQLKAQSELLNISEWVKFLGYCRDVPQQLSKVHVVVHPANFEAFGRVVLESIAAGRPVVGSNNGGIPEIIDDGETGFLVDIGDINGYVKAVLQLIEDKCLWENMSAAGSKRAHSRFTLDDHVKYLAEIYDEILTNHKTRLWPFLRPGGRTERSLNRR